MKTKHKVFIVSAIAMALVAASIFNIAAEKLPQYRKIIVTRAARTTMGQTLNLKGYIEANAKQEINLSTSQKVSEVYIQEGQEVKAGDTLLKLDDSDIAFKLKSEQLSLIAAQNEWNELLKSEAKDKKDLMTAVTQAEIQYSNAADDFKAAQMKVEQNQKLFEAGFLTKDELDTSKKNLDRLEDAMQINEMQLEKAKDNLTGFADQRKKQLDKLRSNIELIKMNIENTNSKINISTKALITGKVVTCKLQGDQYPTTENSRILIYDMSSFVIPAYVKQNEAVQMQEGQKAVVTVKGLEHKKYEATVVDIEDTASLPQNGAQVPMVKVKVLIDKPDQNIKVGFETEVKIDLNIRTDVVAINFQGLVEDHNGNKFVYLFKDNKAERKLIKTGIEDGMLVEIVEGLIPGDQYILNPPERVQEQPSFKLWSWGYELQ